MTKQEHMLDKLRLIFSISKLDVEESMGRNEARKQNKRIHFYLKYVNNFGPEKVKNKITTLAVDVLLIEQREELSTGRFERQIRQILTILTLETQTKSAEYKERVCRYATRS